MTLKIHYFNGIPFVATPYQHGVSVRQDIFSRQFQVVCDGMIEYPEDNPIYGTYQISTFFDLGSSGLITEAMSLAQQTIVARNFVFSPDSDALNFWPQQITIRDRLNRRVLSGTVKGSSIHWCPPTTSDKEAELATRIANLYSEAAYESGWDNYETARHLRTKAKQLEGQQVHPFWRKHVTTALAATQ